MSPADRIPGEVQVKKSADIKAPDGPQTDGMIRMSAIVGMSDQICGTDTIVYAAKGRGTIVSGKNGETRQDLHPGDFALIPAYAEHQEVNESDEEVVWIITRGGRDPIVHNLEEWSKSHEILPEQGAF